jgi:hypothetical protein
MGIGGGRLVAAIVCAPAGGLRVLREGYEQ